MKRNKKYQFLISREGHCLVHTHKPLEDLSKAELCSHLLLVISLEDIPEIRNTCRSKKNSCSASDGSKQVGTNTQQSNAESSEAGSDWDVLVEVVDGLALSESLDDDLLILQLLLDVCGAASTDLDPLS